MAVADFTSSLYLGMRHRSAELPGWSALTTGRPAALDPPAGADAAERLAALRGAERAVLARSALHALSDCLEALGGRRTALVVDTGVYPVGRWAVQRAAGTGTPVSWVAHHDVADLTSRVRRLRCQGLRPVVVADGMCTGCGRTYPLERLSSGAIVLLDDTQALGVLGVRTAAERLPYGSGGGGSVAYAGVSHDPVIAVSSLAKAFGAPVACVAGTAEIVERLRGIGSALHSSPPSTVDTAAAVHAMDRNAAAGDTLRAALADRVRLLRREASAHGLDLVGGLFPVQSTPAIGVDAGRRLLRRLAAGGVRAVLRRSCHQTSAVTLVVTVMHRFDEIERAARLLGAGWRELFGRCP